MQRGEKKDNMGRTYGRKKDHECQKAGCTRWNRGKWMDMYCKRHFQSEELEKFAQMHCEEKAENIEENINTEKGSAMPPACVPGFLDYRYNAMKSSKRMFRGLEEFVDRLFDNKGKLSDRIRVVERATDGDYKDEKEKSAVGNWCMGITEKFIGKMNKEDGLKGKRITIPAIGTVVAPRSSHRYDWRLGVVHRDDDDLGLEEGDQLYTAILFLCDVTAENGAIRFWPDTTQLKHSGKKPMKGLESRESLDVVGEKGTLVFFDSDILHQSLPNVTEGERRTIAWNIIVKK